MNPFSESPYWQDFWQRKSMEKNIALYALAPFFQEIAGLLYAAAHLWHPWSVKRIKELEDLARSFSNDAATLRQRGLGWACQNPILAKSPAYVLNGAAHSRRFKSVADANISPNPDATAYLISATVQTLFSLLEIFKKQSETELELHRRIPQISDAIETLMESPYIGTPQRISDEMRLLIGFRGVYAECEGLAYAMARIEDAYAYRNKTSKRKKPSKTDAEIRALADEIGVDFETLKDVFETEYSAWWKISETYRATAESRTLAFLTRDLESPQTVGHSIREAWDCGSVSVCHIPDYFCEEEMSAARDIIKTFISMFLNYTAGEIILSETPLGVKSKLLEAPP